jgi:hypothetical protein
MPPMCACTAHTKSDNNTSISRIIPKYFLVALLQLMKGGRSRHLPPQLKLHKGFAVRCDWTPCIHKCSPSSSAAGGRLCTAGEAWSPRRRTT